jgi:vacuolar-type H+-ATPase subunit I/STV1
MLIDLRTEGINIYFLCPFIGSFCLIGASFSSGQSKFGKYPFLQNILNSTSEILAIIPYLISNKIKKVSFINNNMDTIEKINEKNDMTYNEIDEEQSRIKILDMILLGFVEFLWCFILYIGNDLFNNKFKYFFMSSYILFLTVLQKYLLDNKIYRYQIASLILFFVFDVIYLAILFIDNSLKYSPFLLIFVFVSNLIFSFEITYEKKILKNEFISFYKICIYLGIVSLYLI